MSSSTRLRLALVVLLSGSLLAGCASSSSAAQQITVVLRYDDYSAVSSLALESQLFALFRQRGLTLSVGVIPNVTSGEFSDPTPHDRLPLGQDKGATLRSALEQGAIEVGLHGYSHQTNSAARSSEFSCLDYAAQSELLSRGRALLQQLVAAPVTLFMPPWNTYDATTLRALADLGFTTLSAEMGGPVQRSSPLSFVPFTCYPRDLKAALAAARASGDPDPVLVVLFHSYDLIEANPYRGIVSLPELGQLLDWLAAQPDVRLLSLGQAAAQGRLGPERARTNRLALAWSAALVPPMRVQAADATFLASDRALLLTARARAALFYTALLMLGALATALLSGLVPPRRRGLWSLLLAGGSLAALAVVVYALRDLRVQWRGALMAALAVGGCAGLWLAYLRCRRGSQASGK